MLKAFLFPEMWVAIWFIASTIIPIVWFEEVPDHVIAMAHHYNVPIGAAPILAGFLAGTAWALVLIIPIALWSRLVW